LKYLTHFISEYQRTF